jgi:adenylate cyclase
VANLSAQELAELVPCPVEDVERLADLGLLEPDQDGLFPSSGVHVVRLMAAFEEAGTSLEDVSRAAAEGWLTFPLGFYMPEPAPMSTTYAELAAGLGRPPEFMRRLSRELGLPPPADDRVREEDAEMLSLLVSKLDLADEDDFSRFARLYGGTMQRLVVAGLEFFDRVVRERVIALQLPAADEGRRVYEKAAEYTELVTRVVPWLQRRHREHALLEYIVGATEASMEERGITPRQPRQPSAIAFLDLTGYTALAEERGDQAAAEVAADLARVVQEVAQAHRGRPVKWLGDGVMFHFPDPACAILSGLDLVEQTERAMSLPARIGINAGAVIAQEGDYFGRTVNVAARIADYAQPRDVLVSEEARRHADLAGVEFQPVGEVPLKGVAKPVQLHRASRAGSQSLRAPT